jgi:putative aldouronate transport system substrate-binding protein
MGSFDTVARLIDIKASLAGSFGGPSSKPAEDFIINSFKSGRLLPALQQPTPLMTQAENDKIASILNPIKTYIQESQIKFIKGDWGFDKWDEFIDNINKLGDVAYVVSLYNSKPKLFDVSKERIW